ncbi:MAG: velvet factor-domain-containing protein [Benjaminiella poitrasii]|nr:MAG: velvet factor-domain-containing protein [Benjaminiella poitrasii]
MAQNIASVYNPFKLIIRQQPVHSRTCGIGEKVDRRPIDPPPVVEVKTDHNIDNNRRPSTLSQLFSHLFLVAILISTVNEKEELNLTLHTKLTVGRTVSSLYNLRDLDGSEGAFFVFPDISVRLEGNYRLQMCLFEIQEQSVNYITSVLTEQFTVYSAKNFPGMQRSCPLIKSFAEQGLKIRIRKESGPRLSRRTSKTSRQNSAVRQTLTIMDNENNMTAVTNDNNTSIPVNSLLVLEEGEDTSSTSNSIREDEEKDIALEHHYLEINDIQNILSRSNSPQHLSPDSRLTESSYLG